LYKEKRIEFLNSMIDKISLNVNVNINNLIEYISNRKPNIGLFAGSFNPFHIGHMDILLKAEEIFDKVVIGFGNNPDKNSRNIKIPIGLEYRECIVYNGLITELITDLELKDQKVTLIRGIRNGNDLNYESNQLEFIKDIKPDVNVVYIPTDKIYEHISSSAIRNLEKFNSDLSDKYIVK
jgi:pantetheine-phosphate adenylyltransferase